MYMQTQAGVTLDPQRHGSVMVKLNCKHGTAANVVTLDMQVDRASDASRPLMLPLRDVEAGEELFWDYRCEALPGECNPACHCGGKAKARVPLLQGETLVSLEACPGSLFVTPSSSRKKARR